MLNKEKYAKELEEILEIGEPFGFDEKHNEICICRNMQCGICKFCIGDGCIAKRREWLNSEYVEPVDWSKVPVDTPILVRDSEKVEWKKRHFACINDGKVCTWCNGGTLWSAGNSDILSWNYAKIAENAEKPQDNAWHNLKDQKPQDRQEVLTWDGLEVHEDRWSDDADYFESTDAKEIWWREMPEPPDWNSYRNLRILMF